MCASIELPVKRGSMSRMVRLSPTVRRAQQCACLPVTQARIEHRAELSKVPPVGGNCGKSYSQRLDALDVFVLRRHAEPLQAQLLKCCACNFKYL